MYDVSYQMMMMDLARQGGGYGFGVPQQRTGVDMLSGIAAQYGNRTVGGYMPQPSALGPVGETLSSYGAVGGMAAMFGDMVMRQQFAADGMIPYGNAGSFYQAQQVERNREMQLLLAADPEATKTRAANLSRHVRNLSTVALGQPIAPEHEAAFEQFIQGIAGAGAYIGSSESGAMFLDSLAGSKGDKTGMAAQMMQANRYRLDPVTGQMGMSAKTQLAQVNRLFERLYEEDDTAELLGIRAGATGTLFKYLSNEGLISQPNSIRGGVEHAITQMGSVQEQQQLLMKHGMLSKEDFENKRYRDITKLSPKEVVQLASDDTLLSGITEFNTVDSERVIKGYTKAVGALKELFGEQGRLDAPIPELMNALKALSGNNLQQFDPAELERTVNDMQAVTRYTGMTMDEVFQARQTARHMLTVSGVGKNAVHFEHDVAMQGLIAGDAVAAMGYTGFGALNEEQARHAAMQIASRTVNSETSKGVAALSYMSRVDPSLVKGRAAEILAAANRGDAERVPTSKAAIEKAVAESGMDVNAFLQAYANDNLMQQEMRDNSAILRTTAAAVPVDVKSRLTQSLSTRLAGDANLGVSRDVAEKAVSAAFTALDNMGGKVTNMDDRLRFLRSSIGEAVGGSVSEDQLSRLVGRINTDLDAGVKADTGLDLVGYQSFYGKEAVEFQSMSRVMLEGENARAAALRPLAKSGNMTVDFLNALQKTAEGPEDDANIPGLLKNFLGVANLEAADEKGLSENFKALRDLQVKTKEQTAIQREAMKSRDTEAYDAATKELARLNEETTNVVAKMTSTDTFKKAAAAKEEKEAGERLEEQVGVKSKDGIELPEIKFPDSLKITGTLTIVGVDAQGRLKGEITEGEVNPVTNPG